MKSMAVASVAMILLASSAAAQYGQASYSATFTFQDFLGGTTMTVAYDGTDYWSSSGGGTGGTRLARYDGAGVHQQSYATGLDYRSVFTFNDGAPVYSKNCNNSRQLSQQNAPGSWSNWIFLSGGTIGCQEAVVYDMNGDLAALAEGAGTINRWDTNGNFLGTIPLIGWGVGSENTYPQNRGLGVAGDFYLTYSQGTLSAWDQAGVRVDTATLTGAGSSFDSHFSLSVANGLVFVVDSAGGTWRGYDVGLASQPPPTPAASTTGMLVLAALLMLAGTFVLMGRSA